MLRLNVATVPFAQMTASSGRANHVDNSFGKTAFGPFSITYGTGQVGDELSAVEHVVNLSTTSTPQIQALCSVSRKIAPDIMLNHICANIHNITSAQTSLVLSTSIVWILRTARALAASDGPQPVCAW